jgi:hypothetical protein
MFGYTEQIIWTILRSSFTIDTFTYILISILAIILRTHIDMIMAWCMGTDNDYINMIIHIITSSMLIMNSKYTFDMVHRYKPELYRYVEYLVKNYSEDNFKRWRKYVVMSICIYFYIASYIVTISNHSIRLMIIEFIFCYHVVELCERYYKIKIYQKKEFECKKNSVSVFDDNYHDELFDIKKS